MKHTFAILIPMILIAAACRPIQAPPAPTQDSSGGIIQATSVPITETSIPAIVTTVEEGSHITPPVVTGGTGSANNLIPANGITMEDNGKTFTMHVDESFLLNLGMDVYDWNVEIDDQNILSREINIMVIRGAQGVYLAHNLGTATLTATGNPLCLQSSPPCAMPTILFRVRVIVQ